MLTKEQIVVIRERCKKATSGPWYISDDGRALCDGETGEVLVDIGAAATNKEDADFIVHARQDIPNLLAALEGEALRGDRYKENATTISSDFKKQEQQYEQLVKEHRDEALLANELQITLDMYGGAEGIADAFVKIKTLEAALEDEATRALDAEIMIESMCKGCERLVGLVMALKSAIKSLPRDNKCLLCKRHSTPAKESPCQCCSTVTKSEVDLWEFGGAPGGLCSDR